MLETVGGEGQVESPVEAEDYDEEEDGHDDVVDRLNGGHAARDGESTGQDGQPVTEDRPVGALQARGGV